MTTKWIGSEQDSYSVGTVGFLVERAHVLKGWETAEIRAHPAHTNQSHQPRLYGWCGTTDDVAVYAKGIWRVTRVAKNGRAQATKLVGDDLTDALDALGYPALGAEAD